MKIIDSRHYVLVVEDQGIHFDVFQQGDGKFKCLACARYRCAHALFVKSSGQVPPRPTREELTRNLPDILTY